MKLLRATSHMRVVCLVEYLFDVKFFYYFVWKII
jgi:hypothetical protein